MISDGALPPRPSLSKRRSRRLRKKLRIAEFQQLGFAVAFVLDGEDDQFWDDFITGCIEAHGLSFGGGETEGYVVKSGRGSASDDDRQAVATWLQGRSDVRDVQVGPLEDAWYAQGDVTKPGSRAGLRLSRQAEIRSIRGKMAWQGNLDAMRQDE